MQFNPTDFPMDATAMDGTDFVGRVNRLQDAFISTNAGLNRPAYAQRGTVWLDNSKANEFALNLFDGAHDVPIIKFDPNTGKLAGTAAKPEFVMPTGGTDRWKVDNVGHLFPVADAVYDLGSVAGHVRNIFQTGYHYLGANQESHIRFASNALQFVNTAPTGKITFTTGAPGVNALEIDAAQDGIYRGNFNVAKQLRFAGGTADFIQSLGGGLNLQSGGDIELKSGALKSIKFTTGSTAKWQVSGAGAFEPIGAMDIGTTARRVNNIYLGGRLNIGSNSELEIRANSTRTTISGKGPVRLYLNTTDYIQVTSLSTRLVSSGGAISIPTRVIDVNLQAQVGSTTRTGKITL